MDFNQIDNIRDIEDRLKKINKVVTKVNYDGNATKDVDGGKWSITNIVQQFDRSTGAQMASTHVNGVTSRGKFKGVSILAQLQVKLKVMTRQACTFDKNENKLDKCPVTDEFILASDKPKDGDIVRVSEGQKVINPVTEKDYTKKELDYMKMSGEPTYNYEDYVVEKGVITVSGVHAQQLLNTKGHRLVVPEFKRPHSEYIKEPTKGKQRRITNWLFKEIGDAPKKKTKPVVTQANDN